MFKQLTNKEESLNLNNLESSFFKNGFVIEKEEIENIYKFLLEKAKSKDGIERTLLDFATFDALLLELNQDLNKEIMDNKF